MADLNCAALNNEGVYYFLRGELSVSLARFRSALEATIGSLDPTDSQNPSTPSSRPLASCPVAMQQVPCNVGRPVFQLDEASSGLQAYNRAINLALTPCAYSSDPLINATVVSSIILFNLALVYHLKGLEGSDNISHSRLISAKSLYMKSRALLDEAGFSSTCSSGLPVVDILTMAIFNNLGQIAFILVDYEQSQTFFDSLVVFCSTVRPQDHQEDNDGALLDLHISAFLVNAITLQQPTHASAA
jgi:hypothetical protein